MNRGRSTATQNNSGCLAHLLSCRCTVAKTHTLESLQSILAPSDLLQAVLQQALELASRTAAMTFTRRYAGQEQHAGGKAEEHTAELHGCRQLL